MLNTVMQSGEKVYGVNHYTIDNEEEVSTLPTYCSPGSSAKVIETGNTYIMNGSHEWIKQPASGGGGGSSPTSGETEIIEF